MRIKNWIKWIQQMSKIWEKIWTRTYCKFLLLPFKCESQSGPENQMIREMSSHCDKNSAHNIGGKYRWIPLMSHPYFHGSTHFKDQAWAPPVINFFQKGFFVCSFNYLGLSKEVSVISLPQIITDLENCHIAFLYMFLSNTWTKILK